MVNILLIIIVLLVAAFLIIRFINKRKNEQVEEEVQVDDKTYTLEKMTAFIKKRLDEITKVNLYDIGLSEEELKRRKNKKYELKKALKGCTYGDVNDKKYVKELIFDLLYKEYGVDETNVSKAIPFDVPSLLTSQDKFEIILYMYKNEFGYEAMAKIIDKYKLDDLKYVAGETKPSYVIELACKILVGINAIQTSAYLHTFVIFIAIAITTRYTIKFINLISNSILEKLKCSALAIFAPRIWGIYATAV